MPINTIVYFVPYPTYVRLLCCECRRLHECFHSCAAPLSGEPSPNLAYRLTDQSNFVSPLSPLLLLRPGACDVSTVNRHLHVVMWWVCVLCACRALSICRSCCSFRLQVNNSMTWVSDVTRPVAAWGRTRKNERTAI